MVIALKTEDVLLETSRVARVCVVNAGRLDFDGKLNLRSISKALFRDGMLCITDTIDNNNDNNNKNALTAHSDASPTPDVVAERAKGHNCIVTKEIEVDVELLPDSVELICEAGTGFNNINLQKSERKRHPSHERPRIFHGSDGTFSDHIHTELLREHDKTTKDVGEKRERTFTNFSGLPHFELEGKSVG